MAGWFFPAGCLNRKKLIENSALKSRNGHTNHGLSPVPLDRGQKVVQRIGCSFRTHRNTSINHTLRINDPHVGPTNNKFLRPARVFSCVVTGKWIFCQLFDITISRLFIKRAEERQEHLYLLKRVCLKISHTFRTFVSLERKEKDVEIFLSLIRTIRLKSYEPERRLMETSGKLWTLNEF